MYRIGQVLSMNCGLYTHFMIAVNSYQVVHASKEKGVVVCEYLSDIAKGKPITNHGRWSDDTDDEVLQRAGAEIGSPYRFVSSNCEHLVRKVSGLKINSPQIVIPAIIGAACIVIFYLVGKK
jgi:hypothetical protein